MQKPSRLCFCGKKGIRANNHNVIEDEKQTDLLCCVCFRRSRARSKDSIEQDVQISELVATQSAQNDVYENAAITYTVMTTESPEKSPKKGELLEN